MSDYYVEVLVKKNIEKEKKIRRVIMFVIFAILIMVGIMTSIFRIYYLLVLVGVEYYFLVVKYCIEFEYFYMDGEFSISKIYNQSRRKKILVLSEKTIKLITPVGSVALKGYHNLKTIDCTANEQLNFPYVIVYEQMGKLRTVYIQMSEELFEEFRRRIPYKVKKY